MKYAIDSSPLAALLTVVFLLHVPAGEAQRAGSTAAEPVTNADNEDLDALEKKLATIEGELAQVIDYRQILANESQYTRGLDRHDEHLINESFWPDAEVSYGTRVDMDELAAWANESHARYAMHQHHVTGLSVDDVGDVAHVEGYIIYSSDMARDSGFDTEGAATPGRVPEGTYATLGSGRYMNRYERREDQWKIRVHEYVHEISMQLQTVDLCARACIGRWDRSDISYLRPLLPLSTDDRQRRAERGKSPQAPVE